MVHGASGAVGAAAVQLAVEHGARVIGSGSPGTHARLRRLGASPVAHGPGMVDRVLALTASGVDRALDVGGHDAVADLVALTGDSAHVVSVADPVGARRAGAHFSTGEGGVLLRGLGRVVGVTAWWYVRGQRNVAERVKRWRPEVGFCQEAIHSSTQLQAWAPVEGNPCVVVGTGMAVEVLTAFGRPRYRYNWAQLRSVAETDVRRSVVHVPGVELRVANRWEDPVLLTFSRNAAFSADAATAQEFVEAVASARSSARAHAEPADDPGR